MAHPVLDPRVLWDARLLSRSQGCVHREDLAPSPREAEARQRMRTRLHKTSNARQSDGNWLSELLSSGTEQLPAPSPPPGRWRGL